MQSSLKSELLSLPQQVSAVVAGNMDGRANNLRYRQKQMQCLHTAMTVHLDEIKTAIAQDYIHTSEEVEAEVCLAFKDVRLHYSSLDLQRDLEKEYSVARGQDNWSRRRGAGIVYIIPTTHTLFYSVIATLSAALAAGNCVIVELPNTTLRISSLLRKILPDALDCDTFAVVETRPSDGFLHDTLVVTHQSMDNVSLDGSHVASPNDWTTAAIVDRTASIEAAATDLVLARFAFNGQSPYSPDIILVNELYVGRLLEAIIKHTAKCLGKAPKEPSSSTLNHGRAPSLLDDITAEDHAQIVVSGTGWGVVHVHNRNSSLLQRKIRGKFLIIHSISSLDDAINFCNQKGTHAATYTFGGLAVAKYVSESILSQTAWINHIPYDLLVGPAVPINSPGNPTSRYDVSVFEVPRPQVVNPTSACVLTKNILFLTTGNSDGNTLRELSSLLPAINQSPGHKIGFFEQGLISGGLVVISSIAGIITAGFWVWKLELELDVLSISSIYK